MVKGIEFDVIDSNSWSLPEEAKLTLQAAAQSLFIKDNILVPQVPDKAIKELFNLPLHKYVNVKRENCFPLKFHQPLPLLKNVRCDCTQLASVTFKT